MITGLNHLTFSVRDLENSAGFYADVLGFELVARWNKGAYLLAGGVWVVLILDSSARDVALPEYSHTAFSVAARDFDVVSGRIKQSRAKVWQENRTEGASLYFLDPNGHKLEIHASDLRARIEADKTSPPEGMEFYV